MTSDTMETSRQTTRLRVMILAISVGGLLMTVKFVAYFLTDSAAILSDALESIINVVASGFALYSIHLSCQPADTGHPYGHGKIEYFSVGFEGALIILAAVAFLYKAIPAFFYPRMLAQLGLGIFLLLGTSAVNLALGLFLIRTGRRTRSILPFRPIIVKGLLMTTCSLYTPTAMEIWSPGFAAFTAACSVE